MGRATVGFVEDSDEDYALLARVFAPSFETERWTTGEQAVEAFASSNDQAAEIAVLLVDHDLPGIDGIAVIEGVRASPGGNLPVICMVSGTGRTSIPAAALAAGADAFLPKPDGIAGLRALVSSVQRLAAGR